MTNFVFVYDWHESVNLSLVFIFRSIYNAWLFFFFFLGQTLFNINLVYFGQFGIQMDYIT